VELLLHSGGGHPDVAYRVMKFFRRRFKQVNVIVPLFAKSSATLMCLGADKIYMGELADLGPIDIQLNDQVERGEKQFSPLDEFKSLEFLREQAIEWMDYYATIMNVQYGISIKESLKDSVPLVSALMRPIFEQIDPVEMGGYRRSVAIGEEYAKRMLALAGNPSADTIVERTVWGYPSHDFCIDIDEAASLGLPVEALPEAQEKALSAAIVGLDKDEYYGFAHEKSTPSRPLRKVRSRKRPRGGERSDKGGGPRPAERISA
jgi:hypothetical protein